MEYVELFESNSLLIYMIATLYVFLNNNFRLSQKFIIAYILSYTLVLLEIVIWWQAIIGINVAAYVYMVFLDEDIIKKRILKNPINKTIDYLYRVNIQYLMITFIVSITIPNLVVQQPELLLKIISIIISIFIFIKILNSISSEKFLLYSFEEKINKMKKIIPWQEFNKSNKVLQNIDIIINIEDKSYFIRDDKYNYFNLKFLIYRIKRIYYLNISRVKNLGIIIRGYSTIEMQLIRTIGVKFGYNCIFRRKIYEWIYSYLFFDNLLKYFKRQNLSPVNSTKYKEYLIYIYLNVAKIKINGKEYKNIMEVWGKDKFEDLTREEVFIGTLGLAFRRINQEILEDYKDYIQNNNLEKNEVLNKIEHIEGR